MCAHMPDFVEKVVLAKVGVLSCSFRDGEELTYPPCSPLLSETDTTVHLLETGAWGWDWCPWPRNKSKVIWLIQGLNP